MEVRKYVFVGLYTEMYFFFLQPDATTAVNSRCDSLLLGDALWPSPWELSEGHRV